MIQIDSPLTMTCGKSRAKPLAYTALLLLFVAIGILGGEVSSFLGVITIAFTFLWVLVGLPLLLSWGARLADDEIAVGYRLPKRRFHATRKIKFHEIGKVSETGLGDVVIFRRKEYVFPGKHEIVLSRDMTAFDILVRRILKSVDPSTVDPNLFHRFSTDS